MNEKPLEGTRVAILVQNLPVPFDRRVWQESKALRDAGADVTVVCPSDAKHPAGRFVIEGITVHRYLAPKEAGAVLGYVNEYGVSLLRMRAELKDARRAGAFDVIQFCNPPDLLYAVAKPYKRRDGSTLVFDQHDLGPELVRAKHLPLAWFFVRLAALFERWTFRAADHVVSTNESYRAVAESRGGFPESKVTVVRSGPPRDWADAVQKKNWHRGRAYLLGYVGVMGRQEGIEYLIEALRILVEDLQLDIHLALIGSGPDRARLEDLARVSGHADRIEFHGRVTDDDLLSILSDADVCVNPDEVNEMNDLSTMNKIVEYMALGRPIVQFDVREGRFSAQEASAYADANSAQALADAIGEVLRDPDRAARMGEVGRQRFRAVLAWENQAEALVAAYTKMIRDRGTIPASGAANAHR